MPLISVIIPVYNAEKYIESCIKSVQAQTFSDFEIICVNDGSSDSSLHILQKMAIDDNRIKVYSQANQGGSGSRNTALKYATGEYIAFLDNDDLYHPQYLEILYHNIAKYNADVSTCSYEKFHGRGKHKFVNYYTDMPQINFISEQPFTDKFKRKKKIETLMWAKLYKSELINGDKPLRFSPELPAINDILFNIDVLLKSKKVVVCNKPLIAHRIISESQTQQKLNFKRIDEFKALPIEIYERTKTYTQHKNILMKMATRYTFGHYINEFLKRYSPNSEPELYRRIIDDLTWLEQNGYLKTHSLSIKRRLLLWAFTKQKFSLIKYFR